MRTKLVLAIVILCTSLFFEINAQGIIVYKNDGTKIDVPYSELDSIVAYKSLVDAETGISLSKEVNLGLPSGTIWAGWNIGASSPEEYGGFYAWGETEEKDDYSNETYKDWEDSDGDGYLDDENGNLGSSISGTQYDVARQKWGSSWRMPTYDELKELRSECTWTWITYKGVNGYKIKGPNGNSIFLPATGLYYGTLHDDPGCRGYYWSGTMNVSYFWRAYVLCIFDSGNGIRYGSEENYYGLTVRPVK